MKTWLSRWIAWALDFVVPRLYYDAGVGEAAAAESGKTAGEAAAAEAAAAEGAGAGAAGAGAAGAGAAGTGTGLGLTTNQLLAASAASQLAGSYANSRAAREQNAAQERALEQNRIKQHALQDEANQAVLGTAQSFNPSAQNPQLAGDQATRAAAAAPVPIPTQGYQVNTSSAPTVVQSDQERKMAEALTSGREAATRSGALQGYGDTALQNQIRIGHAGQRVGQLGNFSQGLSNTLPYQLQSAYNHGLNWMGAGQTLGALGNLGNLYALTRPAKKAPAQQTPDASYGEFGNTDVWG